ncbi:MAG: RNA polymerase sigma factor [Hyphomicrobiaceae bacterium]|nr:RNA polymerase sigma factor [Hyphomicrobiaceae bacterium]
MTGEITDEQLLAQVARRDQRALRLLMDRHMQRAIALAERIVGGNSDADDIAQEAFLRVWSKAEQFDPSAGRFTSWMYRIVFNLALDRRRAMRSPLPIEDAEHVPTGGPGQLDILLADEDGRAVDRALARLSARQRAAIALFHMDGMSCREAGEVMGLSESAFDSLLNRARKALRQEVQATDGRLQTNDG